MRLCEQMTHNKMKLVAHGMQTNINEVHLKQSLLPIRIISQHILHNILSTQHLPFAIQKWFCLIHALESPMGRDHLLTLRVICREICITSSHEVLFFCD
jgi:hypothetical protein